ncbi:S-formylglutathione hydrolase [Malassezia psittaci]|uniref:S-formylglutathione hydrolase n=1 Tax=Malassezia psittaci TaxID=1821823 RepID=A0AAF0FC17_9BASI|nr:S-formylglutathione hydrolase [Malassezia psittaci]
MSWSVQSQNKVFGGELIKVAFKASSLGDLETKLNVFIPPNVNQGEKVPVLYYLAGLTCTEDNGAQKGGFLHAASQEKIAIVFPDTSPRGAKIDSEDDSYDFGTGAGFYLTATKKPWNKYYNMYDLITKEIPEKIQQSELPIDLERSSIFGHSMGGHGALVIYLRELGTYRSASAFAPISHPTKCPWGDKAFNGYLEGGLEEGKKYDAAELLGQLKSPADVRILVDCGTADDFYKQKQLQPESLLDAAKNAKIDKDCVQVHLRDGYDHSYYFISTFAADHVRWHAKHLKA